MYYFPSRRPTHGMAMAAVVLVATGLLDLTTTSTAFVPVVVTSKSSSLTSWSVPPPTYFTTTASKAPPRKREGLRTSTIIFATEDDQSSPPPTKEDGTEADAGGNQKETEETSRAVRYQKAFDVAKGMKVKELKEELVSRGISTTTMLEKTEFIKAYADAMADNVPKGASSSTRSSSSSSKSSSSSSSSSSAKKTKVKQPEEPRDPSYRDVVTQKFDRQRLAGQSVIDVSTK